MAIVKLNELLQANIDNSLILKEFREREPLQDGSPKEVLAPHKVKQLQVLIRKGAKNLEADWKNAEHLCNKAYKVAGHKLPTPDMKDGWEQYEYLLSFTVGVLSSVRGPTAKWRRTDPKVYSSDIDSAAERMLQKVPGYNDPDELPTDPDNFHKISMKTPNRVAQ